MTTFNVDSLDFEDDEELRTGADPDFATRFDSANDRLELEDLTNATVGYIPRNIGTDLVGGKFAETVSEGKALADDGNVYDTIQGAVDAASSWVKVGPGTFSDSVDIQNSGFTLSGSGERTHIINKGTFTVRAGGLNDITIKNLRVTNYFRPGDSGIGFGIDASNTNAIIKNVKVEEAHKFGIEVGGNSIVVNSEATNTGNDGMICRDGPNTVFANNYIHDLNDHNLGFIGRGLITVGSDGDVTFANNIIENTTDSGIIFQAPDSIAYGNIVIDAGIDGIKVQDAGCIAVNNRVYDSARNNINDSGTGGVVQDNLTT